MAAARTPQPRTALLRRIFTWLAPLSLVAALAWLPGQLQGQCAPTYLTAAISAVTAPLGQYVPVTVAARDAAGNITTCYTGTVTLTTPSDSQSSISSTNPSSSVTTGAYTFLAGDNGQHTFYVNFGTAGFQTVHGTDGTISGTSPAVSVAAVLWSSGLNSYDFSQNFTHTTAVGSTTQQSLTIQLSNNVQFQSVALDTGFGSSGANDFTLGSTNCSQNGTVQSCVLTVTFQPSRPGLRRAPVVVTDSSSNKYYLGLSGVGLGGALAFTPGVINSALAYGSSAAFNFGSVDSAGNQYLADNIAGGLIDKLTTGGTLSVLAGGGAGSTFPAVATTIALHGPRSARVDSAGNIYIADTGDNVVLEYDRDSGELVKLAGTYINGAGSFTGDGGGATSATLSSPSDVAIDASGNLYIADTSNFAIRRVDGQTGIMTLYAGECNESLHSCTQGTPTTGQAAAGQPLGEPQGLALDTNGDLYFADITNHAVYRIDASTGDITLFAGNPGNSGNAGDGNAANNAAVKLNQPVGIAVDTAGNVYISDFASGVVRRVDATPPNDATPGIIHTIAGGGSPAAGIGDGLAATDASLNHPQGVWVDSVGTVYIGDSDDNEIRSIAVSLGQLDDFKSVLENTTSTAQQLLLTNVGNQTFNLTAFQVNSTNSPADYANDSGSTTCASSLTQGQSCAYGVAFAPLHLGTDTGSVAVTNSASGGNATASLTGNGVQVSVSPTSATFASTLHTQSSAQTIAFTNPSTTGQTVNFSGSGDGVALSGANAADFTVTNTGGSACSGSIGSAGCSVSVTYTPSTSNAETATLTFTETEGSTQISQTVTLNGGPLVTPDTMTVQAGNNQSQVTGYAYTTPLQVKLTGGGNAAPAITVTFTLATANNGAAGVFATTGTGTVSVVTDVNGLATAPALYANGAVGAFNVTASASGVTAQSFHLTNQILNQNVGSTTASPMTYTFSFSSTTAVAAIQVLTEGKTAQDFTQHTAGATDCIADHAYTAGQSCTVEVDFKPQAPGLRRGAVTLFTGTLQPYTAAQTAYFSGIGVSPAVTFNPGNPPSSTAVGSLNQPQGLWMDANGNLFIVDTGNNRVLELAKGTSNPVVISSSESTPHAVTEDAAGNVFITDSGNDQIVELPRQSDGSFGAENDLLAFQFTSPYGIAADGFGNLYLSDSGAGNLYTFTAAGANLGSFSSVSPTSTGGFTNPITPEGLAVDGNGNLYVADPGQSVGNELYEVNPTTTATTIPATAQDGISAVALDAAGNLYYTSQHDLKAYELRSGSASAIGLTGGLTLTAGGPAGVALDGTGNVYLSDSGQASSANVYKLDLADAPAFTAFTSTVVGGTSAAETVTAANVGNANLTFASNPSFATSNFSPTGTTCSSTAPVAAHGTCTLSATFTPTTAGALSDMLTLTDNTLNGTNVHQTLNASGTGLGATKLVITTQPNSTYTAGATIAVGVSVEDVNNQVVTTDNSTLTLTLNKNSYSTPASCPEAAGVFTCTFAVGTVATGYTVTGTDGGLTSTGASNAFAITAGALASFQVIAPANVYAGASFSFSVTPLDGFGNVTTTSDTINFSSTNDTHAVFPANGAAASGTYSATLNTVGTTENIAVTDSAHNTITGTTTVGVWPTSYNFGAQNVNAAFGPTAVTFVSTGTAIGSVKVLTQGATGLDFADATTGDTCSGTPAQYSTCVVNVNFTPSNPRQRLGAVELLDGSGNVLQTLYLYGSGTGPQVTFPTTTPATFVTSGLGNITGVAFDGSGNLFVGDNANNAVKEFVAPGYTTIKTLGSGFSNPNGVTVDGAGNVFVADGSAVKEILAAGGYTTVHTLDSSVGNPYGIAVDGADNVFFSDAINNNVVEILATGGYATTKTLGGGFHAPHQLVLDAVENVYVADFTSMAVKEITAASGYTTVTTLGSGFGTTIGLAMDASGNLYVGDSGNGIVKEILASGGYTTVNTVASLSGPFAVAFDGGGNLYVGGYDNAPSFVQGVFTLDLGAAPALAFPTTGVGVTSSPLSATLANVGNATLTFTVPGGSNLNPAIASPFALQGATTCPQLTSGSSAATLAAGANCTLSVTFTPTATGAASGNLVETDNNLNGAAPTQTVSLSGTGKATLTITASSPTAKYGTVPTISYTPTTSDNSTPVFTTQPACVTTQIATTAAGQTYTSSCSGAVVTGSYAIVYVNGSGTIGTAPLTISSLTANNKTYDATTAATFSGTATLSGVLNGDSVSVSGTPTGVFALATVANGISVTYTAGLTLSGAKASNYTLDGLTAPLTANITPATVTVSSLTANNKTYDATTNATFTGTGTLAGVLVADNGSVGVTGTALGTFASPNVGNNIVVSYTSGLSLTGSAKGNYTLGGLTSGLTANITPVTVTISSLTANNKTYDATTNATFTGTATLAGVLVADNGSVGVTGTALGTFASPNVGNNIAVSYTSGLSLTGSAKGNYTLGGLTSGLTANITPATVTVSSLTANNKTYDATTNATFTGTATLAGVLALDNGNVGVTGTALGTFASKFVANNIVVSYTSGLSLTGSASGNYTLGGLTAPLSANITPVTLTISSLTANNKTYDTTTAATFTGTATLAGVLALDNGNVGVTGTALGTFASKFVANNIAVSYASGLTLTGSASGNYTLGGLTSALSANITPVTLTISSLTANNKTYDATTAATFTGTATLAGVLALDNGNVGVTGTALGTFASPNVGNSIVVSYTSGLSLTGSAKGNYTLGGLTSALSANITPASLTVSGLTAQNKVYDQTTSVVVTGTPVLNGIIGSDNVTAVGTPNFVFSSANVGNAISVTYTGGVSLGGAQAADYSLSGGTTPLTANITPKPLTVSGITANNKTYDTTTAATVSGTPALVGVISGDTVSLGNGSPVFTFASANVGAGIIVNYGGGATLTGAQAGNYSLSSPATALSANITPATVTISSLTANNKTYDATTAATFTGTATLAGVLALDNGNVGVTGTALGTFASKFVANNIAVSYASGLSLTGSASGNYTLGGLTAPLTANITPATVTVSGLTANNKTYDATTNATFTGAATLAGVLAADNGNVGVSGAAVGTFASKNVGNNIAVSYTSGLALTDSAAGNYTLGGLTSGLTASITPATLTISGLTANSKTYDGGTAATVSGTAVLSGVLSGDNVTLVATPTFTFASANVGTGIALSLVKAIYLGGISVGNYSLGGATLPLSANITAAPLTVTASNGTMVYGGSVPAITPSYSGFVNSETSAVVTTAPTCSTTATATSNAGSYPSSCSGAAAANYSFTYVAGSVTVNQATQTITFPTIANQLTGAIYTLNATASSGLAVSYSVVSGSASISGTTLTVTGTGTITVQATQAGNTNYLAATPVEQSFTAISGATPSIAFSASSLNFGSLPVGTPSGAQTLVISNPGNAALVISNIAVAGDYTSSGTCATIAAGASCSLNLTFTPTALGTRAGTVTFTDNASGSPQSVSLTGIGTGPGVIVTPAILIFGSQVVTTTSNGQSIIIENTGTATLTVSNIAVTGDFATSGNCSTIPAGSSCSISVTFTPTVTGSRTGVVTITDNGGSGTQQVQLQGTGSAAGVVLSPASLTFPPTLLGATSSALTANLTNTGTAALTGLAFAVQGDFASTNTCGASLAAGTSCTISVTYTPTLVGGETGSVTVTDNLGTQLLALAGSGVQPGVSLNNAQLNFGGQLITTQSNAQTVVLTNSGSAALSIASITPSSGFGDNTGCGTSLAAGASCSINVYFAPTVLGAQSGTVTIVDGVGTQTIATTGVGQQVGLEITPSFALYGGQIVATSSPAQTLTLTNNGTVDLTLTTPTVTGDYSQTNTCPTTLTAGSSCTLSVVFSPTALGDREGSITVTDSTGAYSAIATLDGQGTIPGLVVTPANLNFGTINVGSTSPAQIVTLSNSGSAPVSIGAIAINGDYAETDTCLTTVIQPGANCVVSVTMSPTTVGTRTGTIVVTDSTAATHNVALSGAGQNAGLDIYPTSLNFGSLPIPGANAQVQLSGTQLSVSLTNIGSTTISFTGFAVQGDYTESDNCSRTLAPGAKCVLSINFIPLALGNRTGTLTITDNAGGGTQIVALDGLGSPGGLLLTPPVLNFGVQTVGQSSAPQAATLTNQTGENITNMTIVPSGEYSETNACGSTLANGASCPINITITPTTVGAITGTVTVNGTLAAVTSAINKGLQASGLRPDDTSQSFSVGVVALSATANPPGVGLSLPELSFSVTAIGTASTTQTLTLTNTGTGLPLTGLAFTSSPEFPFTTDCPTTLVKGASCHIFVTFTPLGAGLRTGFLNILADGGIDVPVPESGIGLGPELTVSPNTLTYAARAVATTSGPQSLTLENTGGQPLTITAFKLSNPDYVILANGCGTLPHTLAVGATCGVSLTFTPHGIGSRSGTLEVDSNSATGAAFINLNGNGNSGGLQFSATSLAFGSIGVGTKSTQTITVSNQNAAAVAITSFTIAPGAYTETNTCGASLAAGATCQLTVVFAPTVTGEQDGGVTVTDAAGTQVIPVTGAGSDFAITYAGNLPAAVTLHGQNTTYNLGLTSVSGDTQTVSLGCTADAGFSCSITPAAVTIGAQPGTFTLNLVANGTSSAPPIGGGGNGDGRLLMEIGLLLSLLLMLAGLARKRRMGLTLAGAGMLLAFSAACATPQPPANPSTHYVTVNATSTTGETHSKTLNLVTE